MIPPSRDLALLDSITAIDGACAGAVIVSGSHGGVSSSGFVERASQLPCAVFFNDAGVGKDQAGIAALGRLEVLGVHCAVYAHDSARIGDARDGYENGVVTHANAGARRAGVEVGVRVRDAVRSLGAAGPSGKPVRGP